MTPAIGRRGRSGRWRSIALACLAVWRAAGDASAGAGSTAPVTVAAAGSERTVWLIRTSQRAKTLDGLRVTGGDLINVFACQSRGGGKLEAARVAPQVGRIARCAVSGSQLFVFFEDGTHHSYSRDGRRVEIDLPGRAVPEAIAGMTGDGPDGLYAIVRHAVGKEVLRRARRAEAATRPAAGAGTAGTRMAPGTNASRDRHPATKGKAVPQIEPAPGVPASRPAEIDLVEDSESPTTAFDLVAYDGARWCHVAPIEGLPERVKTERLWLCASPDAVYVLWADVAAGEDVQGLSVACRRIAGRAWAPVASLDFGAPLAGGTAMYVEPRVVFAASLRGDSAAPAEGWKAGGSSWRIWMWLGDRWEAGAPLTYAASEGKDAGSAPAQTALASFGAGVFVVTVGAEGAIDVGVWPPEGGAARKPLTKTSVFDLPRRPLIDPRIREWLGLAIVIAVFALVFWRRQESLATAARLPEGFALASYGKRLAAAAIDVVPAMVVTAWLWYGPAVTYQADIAAAGGWREAVLPPPPDALLIGWALARVVYTVYCGAFEYAWGFTPGKWLLGCRVLSDRGERAGLRQIVVRNAMRLIELEPYLQVWPLLLIVFFTRNRQRLGDVLAHTVVVERGTAAPVDGAGESDEGPS